MRYYNVYLKEKYLQTYQLNVGQTKVFDAYKKILAASIERTSLNNYVVIVIYRQDRVVNERCTSMTSAFDLIKSLYASEDV